MTDYIVITQSLVTTRDDIETIYRWDGTRWADSNRAISHGFEMGRADDFNIGRVTDGRLTWFGWMFDQLDHDLDEIAEQIGLRPATTGEAP